MANEIQASYASGSTLYAVIRNRAGEVWQVAGQVFVRFLIHPHLFIAR